MARNFWQQGQIEEPDIYFYRKKSFDMPESVCISVAPDVGGQNPFGQFMNQTASTVGQIGISVESVDQLAQQTTATNVKPSTLDTFAEFYTKVMENLYNYATSFAITQAEMTPNPGETYIPAKAFQQWFDKFQKKMTQNPYFWKS